MLPPSRKVKEKEDKVVQYSSYGTLPGNLVQNCYCSE